MPKPSEEAMVVDFDNWTIRYFLVKESTRNGQPVMTLVREYKRWTYVLKFLNKTDQVVWVFAGKILGPMRRNTDLFDGKDRAFRWTPGVGFEHVEPPHIPYYRVIREEEVK